MPLALVADNGLGRVMGLLAIISATTTTFFVPILGAAVSEQKNVQMHAFDHGNGNKLVGLIKN